MNLCPEADIGAGSYGIWASRAAKAFVRRADPSLGCQLLLVEPFVLGGQRLLQQHLARNFEDLGAKTLRFFGGFSESRTKRWMMDIGNPLRGHLLRRGFGLESATPRGEPL